MVALDVGGVGSEDWGFSDVHDIVWAMCFQWALRFWAPRSTGHGKLLCAGDWDRFVSCTEWYGFVGSMPSATTPKQNSKTIRRNFKRASKWFMSSIRPKVSKAAAAAQVTSSSFPTSICSGWKVVALLLPPRPMGCIHAYGIGWMLGW